MRADLLKNRPFRGPEWVLNIAETRHRAWLNGEPDPYGLPPPDYLPPAS